MKRSLHSFPMLALALAVSQASYAQVDANNDTATTTAGTSVAIFVLSNDTTTAAPMNIVYDGAYESAYGGTVVLGQNNELIYTPAGDFTGEDTFSYSVVDEDGSGYGGSAIVTVTVLDAEEPVDPETSIESQVQGASNKRTARMLDAVCAKADSEGSSALSPELNASCLILGEASGAELQEMVEDIAPEEILVQRTLMANTLRSYTSRLYQFQDSLRPGAEGEAVTINGNGMMLNPYKGGAAGDEAQRWGVFGSVNYDKAEHDQTDYESGYEYDAYGLTLGVDHGLRPDLHVGAAINWLTYDLEYDSNGGTLDSDQFSFTGYASWFIDKFSVDTQLGYTVGDFTTERNISTFSTVADGDTDSSQYNFSTQVDYSIGFEALTVRPYVRVDYMSTQIDGYTEDGGAGWAMEIGDQELNVTESSLGVDTTYAMSFDWGVMVPGLKLTAVSVSSSDYSPVAFHLIGDQSIDGQFALQPDSEDSLFYQVDLGSVFQLKNGIATFVNLQSTLGYDDYSAFQIVGGFNIEI
ncbi:MAG TPA: autotransporter domain-containing protein [Dongiaceae bacterium]|nr:autotransporter domain-containing protein [Dongiaceae bacterium]